MSPAGTRTHHYYQPTKSARIAGVMALIHGVREDLFISFIKRATHPKDQHGGQISFPGGGLDEADNSHLDCALRETKEEIGVPVEKIHIVGALTPLFVFASDNMVYPYVGYYTGKPDFLIDPSEVASIINIPLTYMERPDIVSLTTLSMKSQQLREVPYYDINGHVLWGATAMMMAEFLVLWKDIK